MGCQTAPRICGRNLDVDRESWESMKCVHYNKGYLQYNCMIWSSIYLSLFLWNVWNRMKENGHKTYTNHFWFFIIKGISWSSIWLNILWEKFIGLFQSTKAMLSLHFDFIQTITISKVYCYTYQRYNVRQLKVTIKNVNQVKRKIPTCAMTKSNSDSSNRSLLVGSEHSNSSASPLARFWTRTLSFWFPPPSFCLKNKIRDKKQDIEASM